MDTVTPGQALPAPTADEKSMAMLSHLLMIFAGFIPPLVIYLVKRESKFVAFHAIQGLLWQALVFVLYMIGFVGIMISMLLTFPATVQKEGGSNQLPIAYFGFLIVFWILFFGIWMTNLVLGIVYCVKANRGEWSAYPLFGRWARRIVGI